jgi:hypothetical protein
MEDRIKDVWSDNLDEEFTKIRDLLDTHPYVAMVHRWLIGADLPGYGVSWCGGTADRPIQEQLGVSISDAAIQCGLTTNHSTGLDFFG